MAILLRLLHLALQVTVPLLHPAVPLVIQLLRFLPVLVAILLLLLPSALEVTQPLQSPPLVAVSQHQVLPQASAAHLASRLHLLLRAILHHLVPEATLLRLLLQVSQPQLHLLVLVATLLHRLLSEHRKPLATLLHPVRLVLQASQLQQYQLDLVVIRPHLHSPLRSMLVVILHQQLQLVHSVLLQPLPLDSLAPVAILLLLPLSAPMDLLQLLPPVTQLHQHPLDHSVPVVTQLQQH